MKLKGLIGLHDLSGVDVATEMHGGNVVNVARFVLDGKTYKAIEDPDDGYRSYLEEIEVTDEKVTNNFPPHKVVGTMKGPGMFEHDIILFIDIVTGKVVLEVGTEDVSDYYPCCVLRWHPENLAINIGR